MKLLVNLSDSTIVLNPGGRSVWLAPKGHAADRKEVDDKFVQHPDVLKFKAKGRIEVLDPAEAAKREAAEAKQEPAPVKAEAAPVAAPVVAPVVVLPVTAPVAAHEPIPVAPAPALEVTSIAEEVVPAPEAKAEEKAEEKLELQDKVVLQETFTSRRRRR